MVTDVLASTSPPTHHLHVSAQVKHVHLRLRPNGAQIRQVGFRCGADPVPLHVRLDRLSKQRLRHSQGNVGDALSVLAVGDQPARQHERDEPWPMRSGGRSSRTATPARWGRRHPPLSVDLSETCRRSLACAACTQYALGRRVGSRIDGGASHRTLRFFLSSLRFSECKWNGFGPWAASCLLRS